MPNPLAMTFETKISGIPLDIIVEAMPLSSDKVRFLGSTMAGSQKIDLHVDQVRALHGLILRAISAAENYEAG